MDKITQMTSLGLWAVHYHPCYTRKAVYLRISFTLVSQSKMVRAVKLKMCYIIYPKKLIIVANAKKSFLDLCSFLSYHGPQISCGRVP